MRSVCLRDQFGTIQLNIGFELAAGALYVRFERGVVDAVGFGVFFLALGAIGRSEQGTAVGLVQMLHQNGHAIRCAATTNGLVGVGDTFRVGVLGQVVAAALLRPMVVGVDPTGDLEQPRPRLGRVVELVKACLSTQKDLLQEVVYDGSILAALAQESPQ